jgi:hypothetical protein
MRKNDLMTGARYIILRGSVGVYEGMHDGALTLADGSVFYGGDGALRFRIARDDGDKVVLLTSGAEVIEPEETKFTRERQESEHAAQIQAARDEAIAFLARLGITQVAVPGGPYRSDAPRVRLSGAAVDADDVLVGGLSIGELRRIAGT